MVQPLTNFSGCKCTFCTHSNVVQAFVPLRVAALVQFHAEIPNQKRMIPSALARLGCRQWICSATEAKLGDKMKAAPTILVILILISVEYHSLIYKNNMNLL